jgi:hypothetical protein
LISSQGTRQGVTITTWIARVDSFGEVVRDSKRNWVIAGPGVRTSLDAEAGED